MSLRKVSYEVYSRKRVSLEKVCDDRTGAAQGANRYHNAQNTSGPT